MKKDKISSAVIRRLPRYYRHLDDLYQNIRAEMRFLLIEDFLRSAGLDEALQHFMIPSG